METGKEKYILHNNPDTFTVLFLFDCYARSKQTLSK
jgi:hypothetical protein